MQRIPNIVAERLKRGAAGSAVPASSHPDADLLNAFAERSLPKHERQSVVDHLARCSDCRDVIALALPEAETPDAVVKPLPSRWLSWPALRWGFALAGVVIIGTFGVMRLRFEPRRSSLNVSPISHSERSTARLQGPASPAAGSSALMLSDDKAAVARKAGKVMSTPAKKTGELSASADTRPVNKPEVLPQQQLAFRAAAPAPGLARSGAIGGPVGKFRGFGPKMPAQGQQQNLQGQQALSPPIMAGVAQVAAAVPSAKSSTTVEVSGESPLIATEAVNNPPVPQLNAQENSQDGDSRLGRAKPATAPPPIRSPIVSTVAPAPRWTITPSGGLQRSFDQGQTWENVDVNAGLAPAAGAAMRFSNTVTSSESKDITVSKQKVAAPIFRVVEATGTDVWAGGSAGVLYHSVDAGVHWTRVVPSSGGVALTGDIVSLDFADAQHGQVATSLPETWTTADGGRTWEKQ